jgi:tight adherence protein C
MSVLSIVAALCAALAVGFASARVIHPLRPISGRMRPYTEVARGRLGLAPDVGPEPILFGEALRRVVGPLAEIVGRRMVRLFRVGDIDAIDLKLRQAGHPMTIDAYRSRHVAWTVGTPLLLILAALYLSASAPVVILVALLGAAAGMRRMPAILKALTAKRCDRMRNDLYTIAQLLAVRIQARSTLLTAIRELVDEGSGPVIEDLNRALNLIAVGYGDEAAFRLLDKETPEPAAGIFYRFLASATIASIDLPPALLQQATETRNQRREEIERTSIKRTIAMLVPNLLIMAPVMILFMAAPLPSLVFGK